MKAITEEIDSLKAMMANGDDIDFKLSDIICNYGSGSIRPLLTMADYPEDRAHEMYAVTHGVESFPADTYISELVQSIGEMSKCCTLFMQFLLVRLTNSEDDCQTLIRIARAAPEEIKKVTVEAVTGVRSRYFDQPDIREHCDKVLAGLSA